MIYFKDQILAFQLSKFVCTEVCKIKVANTMANSVKRFVCLCTEREIIILLAFESGLAIELFGWRRYSIT